MAASQSTILVVEDEPLLRLILIEALQHEGYRVLAASNVLEAIGYIARHAEIDGLVTDVDLPGGLSGLDLLELLSNCRPNAARIVVSGRGDLEEAAFPSAVRIFAKPYSLDDVIAELDDQITAKNAIMPTRHMYP
ncbi:response regulator [Shinella kummerowiae]|jgi:DNA-binding NtrC family response regulator|uniref:Response regulator n=1 Tax=Shinella kummerowiae TaxID=417745 RepID=A0A6N8SJC6_9HYPH|nr:response regulator [Shinella kummerowiae]MCT7668164.1 response regulator [Shinella kummerowiae]MXN49175.1 response regulator [Shinella kummerowiae]